MCRSGEGEPSQQTGRSAEGQEAPGDESRDDDDYASDLRLEIGTLDSRLSGVAGLFARERLDN